MPRPRRGILFLCVANSARSQMAEGIARALAPDGIPVFSAGSRPTAVHPLAIEAMQADGVDLSGQTSKGLDAVPLGRVDTIITLCAEEFCPELGDGIERLHWPLPDPAAACGSDDDRIEAFRAVGADLRTRIAELLA